MNIQQFWSDVLAQRADEIREYFHADAFVNWHCSNEHFTVEEFIRANCDYPGDWDGDVEKIVMTDDMIITATRVYPKDRSASFHVTSCRIGIPAGNIQCHLPCRSCSISLIARSGRGCVARRLQ